jgi:hypothetical protein
MATLMVRRSGLLSRVQTLIDRGFFFAKVLTVLNRQSGIDDVFNWQTSLPAMSSVAQYHFTLFSFAGSFPSPSLHHKKIHSHGNLIARTKSA